MTIGDVFKQVGKDLLSTAFPEAYRIGSRYRNVLAKNKENFAETKKGEESETNEEKDKEEDKPVEKSIKNLDNEVIKTNEILSKSLEASIQQNIILSDILTALQYSSDSSSLLGFGSGPKLKRFKWPLLGMGALAAAYFSHQGNIPADEKEQGERNGYFLDTKPEDYEYQGTHGDTISFTAEDLITFKAQNLEITANKIENLSTEPSSGTQNKEGYGEPGPTKPNYDENTPSSDYQGPVSIPSKKPEITGSKPSEETPPSGETQPSKEFVGPVTGQITPHGEYGAHRGEYEGHSGHVGEHTHAGTDFRAPLNSPVVAVKEGKVIRSSYVRGYGNTVDILHPDGSFTRYAHLANPQVKVGDTVKQGQQVGAIGVEGHVHFEAHTKYDERNPGNNFGMTTTVDPKKYLGLEGNTVTANQPIQTKKITPPEPVATNKPTPTPQPEASTSSPNEFPDIQTLRKMSDSQLGIEGKKPGESDSGYRMRRENAISRYINTGQTPQIVEKPHQDIQPEPTPTPQSEESPSAKGEDSVKPQSMNNKASDKEEGEAKIASPHRSDKLVFDLNDIV